MSTYRGVNAHLAKCLNIVLNMKVPVGASNQEMALLGAFSVIDYEPSDGPLFQVLFTTCPCHVYSVSRVADMIQAEMWRREGSLSSCTKLDYGSSAIEQRFRNSLCIKEV